MASWLDRLTGYSYLKGPPRTLNDADYVGFFEAADRRVKPKTREQMIAYIESRNAFRWWRLKHDYKWLKKQCKKMGLNPDEARELLP